MNYHLMLKDQNLNATALANCFSRNKNVNTFFILRKLPIETIPITKTLTHANKIHDLENERIKMTFVYVY